MKKQKKLEKNEISIIKNVESKKINHNENKIKSKIKLKKKNFLFFNYDQNFKKIILLKFFIKTSLKSLWFPLFLIIFLLPIILGWFSYFLTSNNVNFNKYYGYFPLCLGFIFLTLMVSSFIVFSYFCSIKFNDLQYRIALLRYKNIGFLIISWFFVLIYIIICNFVYFITYISISFKNHYSFISIFNFHFIFYILFSLLLSFIFVTFFLLVTSYIPTNKWGSYFLIFFFDVPVVIFIILLIKIKSIVFPFHIFSLLMLLNYLIALLAMFSLSLILMFLFNTFYRWKR